MRHRIYIGLTAFFMLLTISASAQVRITESIHDGKLLVMLTPQYLLVDQCRIEIDYKIAKQHWISIAPHYVQNLEQYKEHSGYGLSLMYKFFRQNNSNYFGVGAQFTQHSIDHFALDDLSQSDLWLFHSKVTQYGFNVVSGHYFRLFPHVFGDIYYGVGYRLAKISSSDLIFHDYNKGFLDCGYQGFMLVLGLRFGILW